MSSALIPEVIPGDIVKRAEAIEEGRVPFLRAGHWREGARLALRMASAKPVGRVNAEETLSGTIYKDELYYHEMLRNHVAKNVMQPIAEKIIRKYKDKIGG